MKFLRSPDRRHLLRMLTSARRRAGLTQAELADKVTASQGFALEYESGERGPIAFSKRPGTRQASDP